jgi:hypothetical protein
MKWVSGSGKKWWFPPWVPPFWVRMYFPVITVFEGQIEAWVNELIGKVGLGGEVEKVIEAELNRISEKVQESECTEVILINGGFVLNGWRRYQIITTNVFLDRIHNLLQEGISKLRVRGEERSVLEGSEDRSKVPSLEEFISHPLPIVGYDDVQEWITIEEREVLSIVDTSYEPDEIADIIWNRDNIDKVWKILKGRGSKYITVIKGSVADGTLKNECRVEEVSEFINDIVGEIHDYVLEELADRRW